MRKPFIVITFAALAFSCGSPGANNTASNAVANRANTNANAGNTATNSAGSTPNVSNTAVTPSSSLSSLKSSAGKTATEIKLWENKDVSARLETMMGAEYAKMKKFWNTEGPIRVEGDVLMMTGCEQHNCGPNQYVIFVDTAKDNINVMHLGDAGAKDWKEKGEIALPKGFADALAGMKGK